MTGCGSAPRLHLHLKGNAEGIFLFCFLQLKTERKLIFNNETPEVKKNKHPKRFQTVQGSEREIELGTAPFPLHPGGCEGLCALGRCLNAPLEAAGQAQVLKKENKHI